MKTDQGELPLAGGEVRSISRRRGQMPHLNWIFLRVELMTEPGEIWEFAPAPRPPVVVTSHGRVIDPRLSRRTPRLMPGKLNPDGYRMIVARHSRPIRIATLVAATHLGPKPAGCMVLHWDGNRTNDRAENLRYGTAAENYDDAVRHGTQRRRFDENDVIDVLRSDRAGETDAACAAKYGVSTRTIYNIRTGRTYARVAPEILRRPAWTAEFLSGENLPTVPAARTAKRARRRK